MSAKASEPISMLRNLASPVSRRQHALLVLTVGLLASCSDFDPYHLGIAGGEGGAEAPEQPAPPPTLGLDSLHLSQAVGIASDLP